MNPCVKPGEFADVAGESGSRRVDAAQARSGAGGPCSRWQVAGLSVMDLPSRLPQ